MPEEESELNQRIQANQTAVRNLFYWSTGITFTLILNALFDGPVFETLLPLWVTGLVAIISGVAYWRRTTPQERRHDVVRKATDPFYE